MEDLEQLEKDYAKMGETIAKMKEPVFDYPIYKRLISTGLVVKFGAMREGIVAGLSNNSEWWIGAFSNDWTPHTSSDWQPCEAPKWKPTEPTWCWVKAFIDDESVKRLVLKYEDSHYAYTLPDGKIADAPLAEPCEEKDTPQWWKDLKSNK